MTTVRASPRDVIAAYRAADPGLIDLAEAVCLAVRVEPLLLRRARLRLCPRAEAGTESALWFSRLVGSRSSAALVLDREVLAVLRQTVRDKPTAWLDDARGVVAECHASGADALRLEEEVVWLAVRDGDNAASGIDARLRRAVKTMATMPDRAMEVARWADRALLFFPETALETESANLLALGAAARLERTTRVSGMVRWPRLPASSSWILPAQNKETPRNVGVRLHEGEVQLVAPDALLAQQVAFPGRADVVEVQWTAGNGALVSHSMPLTPGRRLSLGSGVRQVEVRAPGGAWFRLSAVPDLATIHFTPQLEQTVSEWPADLRQQLTTSLRHLARRPGDGVQLGKSILYRDPDHRCDVQYRRLDQPALEPGVEVVKASRVTPHVFLSYAKADAERIERLGLRISPSGSEIWSDRDSIAPGESWVARLERWLSEELSSATTFGVVLSRTYLSSEVTTRELESILSLTRAGYTRLVPMTLERELLGLPDELRDLHIVDLSTEGGLEQARKALEPKSKDERPRADATVVLTATAGDVRDYGERLQRELLDRGYTVLPVEPREPLGPVLFVHLLGSRYNDDVEAAVVSAQRGTTLGARTMVWVHPNTDLNVAQQEQIRRLEYELPVGTEVLRTSFAELQEHVLDTLRQSREPSNGEPRDSDLPVLMLVCQSDEIDDAAELRRRLAGRADVRIIGKRSEPAAARRELTTADGVLIYWGSGPTAWLEANLVFVQKAVRQRPVPVAVFVAQPMTSEKQSRGLPVEIIIDDRIGDGHPIRGGGLMKFVDSLVWRGSRS